ncbi:hypothetical protein NPIL_29431 [Nephila pilipes]|uniref:Uncharacterized protein n=1 Tax=Nephila pilipes TaxID=299642 RepID=A0A8X6NZD9_NEPPI|nr:hypothetical protein NPIL_29431 [Nephila pilipes]
MIRFGSSTWRKRYRKTDIKKLPEEFVWHKRECLKATHKSVHNRLKCQLATLHVTILFPGGLSGSSRLWSGWFRMPHAFHSCQKAALLNREQMTFVHSTTHMPSKFD